MTNKCTWIYECKLITQKSPTCFGHSFDHLPCGETQNKNINIIWRTAFIFLFPSSWRWRHESPKISGITL